MAARLLVALGLAAWLSWAYWHGTAAGWLLAAGLVYLASSAAVLRWSRPVQTDSFWAPTWLLTLWADLLFFSLLQWAHVGGVNFMPLFVLPVLLAAVLGPLKLALGSAAFATLALLLDAAAGNLLRPQHADTYAQGAISGAGLFLVALLVQLLVQQLAQRLGREQAQASDQRALADAQAQVNQLIATGLSEGVLVLDGRGQIWHANPAACAMLGAPDAQAPYAALTTLPAWPLLAQWARACLHHGRAQAATLKLPTHSGEALQVQARARLNPAPWGQPALTTCVIFLESQRKVEARVRTEKLAAMGRVTAAVAHEIRNPLAAISQANALLAEETLPPAQQRLVAMIGHNARRLGRTVDDILELARLPARPDAPSPLLALDASAAAILDDWRALHPAAELHWQAGASGFQVPFEAEHLRRVLVNLLDNALRHSSTAEGHGAAPALWARTRHDAAQVLLQVWNAGAAMPAEVETRLFEPFNSSNSRSSGLGLYLARQLCQRHGAQLVYQRAALNGVQGHAFSLVWHLQGAA